MTILILHTLNHFKVLDIRKTRFKDSSSNDNGSGGRKNNGKLNNPSSKLNKNAVNRHISTSGTNSPLKRFTRSNASVVSANNSNTSSVNSNDNNINGNIPCVICGGSKFVYVSKVGKRKLRYTKTGRKYVISNGKRKYLK